MAYGHRGATGPGDVVLAAACERALASGARAHGVGTRQQVRAAARHFVRRHRRDAGYLAWVLRSVGASSALAVTLLGLSAAPAAAEFAPFAARTGAANPLNGQDVGDRAVLAFGDLNSDGALDLVAGESDGVFNAYLNTGDANNPAFVQVTGIFNPLNGQDVGAASAPVLGDLDGDGDLDLVAGESDGFLNYYENTGSATLPAFVLRTGAANPLNGQDVGYDAVPVLGDLDGDGDLDLVVGERYGTFAYFENTGSATAPAFVLRTGAANPLTGHYVTSYSAPALGDLDGDGDLDLGSSGPYGTFAAFENTGSATSPAFASVTGAANPLDGQYLGSNAAPSFGDLDGDGDLDVAIGQNDGTIAYYEHLGGRLVPRTGAANPLDGVFLGDGPGSSLGDLDDDGDLDVVAVGGISINRIFFYYENTGGSVNPAFAQRTGAANPLDSLDLGIAGAMPSLGDLNGDGDLDLVVGSAFGGFGYFENTGSATNAAFIARTGAANPLAGQDVGYSSSPSLGDLDGDGDIDLVSGASDGTFRYFENTGSTIAPVFVVRTGAANPLDGQDVGSSSAPALGDVDRDGDPDLVASESGGLFNYYENTGSATTSAFVLRTGAANPLNGQDMGSVSAPALGDLDSDGDRDLVSIETGGTFSYFESFAVQAPLPAGALIGAANPLNGFDVGSGATSALGDLDRDGDLDLVAGESNGGFAYFENTSSATAAAFVQRTGAANPLNGQDVGSVSAPALGDLDGDGDLDLVTGRDTAFGYFENTGDATLPAFVLRTGAANPIPYLFPYYSRPTLGDLDGDGDLDLVAGELGGAFLYFENTGSGTNPGFVYRTGAANPLNGQVVGGPSAPALNDFDGDGDLDLASGELTGTLAYFKNQGSATSPAFTRRTGAANPLDGEDVGTFSAPTAGDLDGDGDLDLVTGKGDGTFAVHYFPEPSRGLLLGAGVALLWLLERIRRRR